MRVVCLVLIPLLMCHAQAPVIRTETREVAIDVAVTANKGGLPALAPKDFSLWEDGKPQKINSVAPAASDSEAAQKHFVLYFDFTTMALPDQSASEKYAADLIDAMLTPDRYFAVMALSGNTGVRVLQDFTTAKAPLKAAAAPLNASARSLAGSNNFFVDGSSATPTTLADSVAATATAMTPAPGRKAILLFTGGYAGAENNPRLKQLAIACNRANVALYVIAPASALAVGGFGNRAMSIQQIAQQGNNDTQPSATFANVLADSTGGRALTFSSALPGQLDAVIREQDDYYRLTYTPPPAKEGSCHTIRLAAANHSLATRSRTEYCTEKAVDLVAGKIAGQELEARAAGVGTLTATMQLPWFYTGTNRAGVHLAADITGTHGPLDIVGTTLRQDNATAARFADTAIADTHYEHQFTLAAGTYNFQLAAGDAAKAVGKAEAALTIDPWNGATFAISGIALAADVQPVTSTPAGAPVLEGRAPLVAGGKRFLPAATTRFPKTARVYFYTEVYDPAPTALSIQIRILDPKTGAVVADTGIGNATAFIRPGNPTIPFGTAVPTTNLPAGNYRLEVRATHPTGSETAVRTADFELN